MAEKKQFNVEWRHLVIIEAETEEEAEKIFAGLNLGQLDQYDEDGEIYHHEWIETLTVTKNLSDE